MKKRIDLKEQGLTFDGSARELAVEVVYGFVFPPAVAMAKKSHDDALSFCAGIIGGTAAVINKVLEQNPTTRREALETAIAAIQALIDAPPEKPATKFS